MPQKKEIVILLKKLMAFKTTSDSPEELNRCIDFIINYLPKKLIKIKYVKNKKPSLVVTFTKTKKPKLFFVCHLDVVPAPNQLFIPKIRGNKLYGRGSYDDKGTAAALICLVKDFAKENKKPSIGLILSTDEEISGNDGVGYLLNKQAYSCDFAIVPDSGKDFSITIKQKGILRVKISAKGKAAHGSKPWKGENAIEKLMKAYFEIKRAFPKTTHGNRWKATLNLGWLKGGDVVNKVPDYAEAELDIRFTENEPLEGIIKSIKRHVKEKGIKLEFQRHKAPLSMDPKNRYILKLKDSIEKTTGRKPVFNFEHGATDACFFSEKKIPVAMVMPGGGNVHSAEEFTEIEGLDKFYRLMRHFIEENAQ